MAEYTSLFDEAAAFMRAGAEAGGGSPRPLRRNAPGVTVEESTLAHQIQQLMELTEALTKRIELEKRKGMELDKKVVISRTRLEETRGRIRGLVAELTDGGRTTERALKAAEHRLEVVTGRLDRMRRQNEAIKRVIDGLRHDKLQRQRILRGLEREVTSAAQAADAAKAEAAAISEARDRSEREAAALQSALTREMSAHEAENEARLASFAAAIESRKRSAAAEHAILGNLADARALLPTVASTSATLSAIAGAAERAISSAQGERPGAGLGAGGGSASGGDSARSRSPGGGARAAAAVAAAAAAQQAAEETTGSMTVEQEIELKHRSARALWECARREVEVAAQRRSLEGLEDAFARIQAGTHISSIDAMVAAFTDAEDRAAGMMAMINGANTEIQALEVEVAALRAAVDDARSRSAAGHRARDSLEREWGDQIALLSSKAAAADAQCEAACRALDALKPGVHALFQRLGSPDPALADALSSAGVTEGNLMQHMGCIEQRVHAVVHMHEMASSGVPLSLPLQEAELVATGWRSATSPATAPASAMNGALQSQAQQQPGMPGGADTGVPVDVPISKVGGVGGIGSPAYADAQPSARPGGDYASAGAGGAAASGVPWRAAHAGLGPSARARRAVIAPSLRDLEDDSEDSEDGAGTATLGLAGMRRGSRAGSRATGAGAGAGAGGEGGLLAGQGSVGAPGSTVPARLGDAALSAAPLDPAVLRAHTIALVESKQARAAARERMAMERHVMAYRDRDGAGALAAALASTAEGAQGGLTMALRTQQGHDSPLSPGLAGTGTSSGASGGPTPGSALAGGRRASAVERGTGTTSSASPGPGLRDVSALPVTSPIAQHGPADAATALGLSVPTGAMSSPAQGTEGTVTDVSPGQGEITPAGAAAGASSPGLMPGHTTPQRVPRPPSEPSVRSHAARPGATRALAPSTVAQR